MAKPFQSSFSVICGDLPYSLECHVAIISPIILQADSQNQHCQLFIMNKPWIISHWCEINFIKVKGKIPVTSVGPEYQCDLPFILGLHLFVTRK